jgi:ketosteroid isomerase-like protein
LFSATGARTDRGIDAIEPVSHTRIYLTKGEQIVLIPSSKRNALVSGCVLIFVFAFMLSASAVAQEWSKEQLEVWQNVEAYWDHSAQRDLDGMLSYFHDDYLGWSTNSPLPDGKAEVEKWLKHMFATTTEVLHTIQPVGIAIHDDIAIVHYYYSELEKNAKGEEEYSQGRWTDILKKQGGRWVLVADQGGKTSGE